MRLVSQPLSLLPSQSPKPAAQVNEQVLAEQVALAATTCGSPEQSVPQAPQLAVVLVRLTSQPSVCLFELQSPKLAAQVPALLQFAAVPGGE